MIVCRPPKVLGDCTVAAGGSIQAALDAAHEGDLIVVCAGVYSEQLLINTPGIILEGRGATLDGTLFTGQRFGIRLTDAARGVTITGFQIQNYRNPLAIDASSGIMSDGPGASASILGNFIHDNSWAGIVIGKGSYQPWRIENNTFAAHSRANIMVEAAPVTIKNNRLNDTQGYALGLTGVRDSHIHNDNALVGNVELRFNATIPGHPELTPDWLNVTVTNETNASIHRTLAANTTGEISYVVNLSGLSGRAWFNVTASFGWAKIETSEVVDLNLSAPSMKLNRFDTLRVMTDSSDAHLYYFEHGGRCNPTQFTVSASSPGGGNIHLYVAQGTPAAQGTNPANYPNHDTTSGSTKELTQTAAQGLTYTVMVRTPDATPVAYFLRWGTPECSGRTGKEVVEPPQWPDFIEDPRDIGWIE